MDPRRAVVAFKNAVGPRQHWLAPLLKDGFRHCGVAVEAGDYWVFVDPNPDCIRFRVPALKDFDIGKYFRDQGFHTVEYVSTGVEVRVPLAVSNCVGVVKTVLGIRKPFIITPYQLYRYLRRQKC